MKVEIAAMLVLSMTSAVLAEEKTFRGIKFGISVVGQLDECPRSAEPYLHGMYLNQFDLKKSGGKTCWESRCLLLLPELCPAGEMHTVRGITFIDSLSDEALLPAGSAVTEQDGKLVALQFRIYIAAFTPLQSLFESKYGKPIIAKESPWQSKGGVRTESHLRIWNWNGLHISLEAPTDDVDHGTVLVATKQYFDQLEKDQLERKKKSLKDL